MSCCSLFNSKSESWASADSSKAAIACVTDPWKKVETTRSSAERLAVSRDALGR